MKKAPAHITRRRAIGATLAAGVLVSQSSFAESEGSAAVKESFIITAHYTMAADNHFDLDYYVTNHIPLIKRFDPDCLIQIDVHQIADPKNPQRLTTVIADYAYPDEASYERSIAVITEPCAEDVKNFTDVVPVVYVGRCQRFFI